MYNLRIIAFYTIGTPYEEEVLNLIESLIGDESPYKDLPHEEKPKFHIKGYPPRESWEHNCSIKPLFIYEMMMGLYHGQDLLYLDVDAIICKKIDYQLPTGKGLGVHYTQTGELLSGTIFLKSNALPLIRRWVVEQDKTPTVWDQKVLRNVIHRRNDEHISVENIPAEYAKIFDRKLDRGVDPIIKHMQASRRYKNKVPRLKLIQNKSTLININDIKKEIGQDNANQNRVDPNGVDPNGVDPNRSILCNNQHHEVLPWERDKPFGEVKKAIVESIRTAIPKQLYGQRVRVTSNGEICIVRKHNGAEAYLDRHFTRIPGTLKWAPRIPTENNVSQLYGRYSGYHCYIFGKGPSLDNVTVENLSFGENDIAMCINESINTIEPLLYTRVAKPSKNIFAVQQDSWIQERCKPKHGSSIITGNSCRYLYLDTPNRYLIAHGQYPGQVTAVVAIKIAKLMGVSSFTLVAFDAIKGTGLDYAKSIGYSAKKGGKLERFINHGRNIIAAVNKCKYKLI